MCAWTRPARAIEAHIPTLNGCVGIAWTNWGTGISMILVKNQRDRRKTNEICGSEGMNGQANLWNCYNASILPRFIGPTGTADILTQWRPRKIIAEDIACPVETVTRHYLALPGVTWHYHCHRELSRSLGSTRQVRTILIFQAE